MLSKFNLVMIGKKDVHLEEYQSCIVILGSRETQLAKEKQGILAKLSHIASEFN